MGTIRLYGEGWREPALKVEPDKIQSMERSKATKGDETMRKSSESERVRKSRNRGIAREISSKGLTAQDSQSINHYH